MKKLLSLLVICCICLLTAFQTALAYDDKIEFRDIPWGTDYDTAVERMGIDFHNMSGEYFYAMAVDDVIYGHGASEYTFENNDINIWAANAIFSLMNSDITVGGFQPTSINMYFAYTPVDGVLTRETKHSELYAASYKLSESSKTDVFTNIYGKLVSLYGEPDDIYTYQDDGYDYYRWNGTDDTALVLKSDDKSSVEIYYVWYGGDQLLVEADEVLSQNIADEAQAEADFIENDMSGL